MTDKGFFEDVQQQNVTQDPDPFASDFTYRPEQEKQNRSFPLIVVVVGLIFGIIIAVLIGEMLAKPEQDQATLPVIQNADTLKTSIDTSVDSTEQDPVVYTKIRPEAQQKEVTDVQAIPVAPKAPVVQRPSTVKVVKKVQTPPTVKTPVATPSVKPVTAVPTGWQVQMLSVSSEKAAEAEWKRLKNKYPNLLSGKQYAVVKKTVSGKTVYRLRVVGLSTRASADALCKNLKALGQSCYVTK